MEHEPPAVPGFHDRNPRRVGHQAESGGRDQPPVDGLRQRAHPVALGAEGTRVVVDDESPSGDPCIDPREDRRDDRRIGDDHRRRPLVEQEVDGPQAAQQVADEAVRASGGTGRKTGEHIGIEGSCQFVGAAGDRTPGDECRPLAP